MIVEYEELTSGSGTGGSTSGGGSSSSSSHLNGDTATERSSTSGVLATDHADVALASDSSCAGHASGHRDSEGKILHLSVPVAATVVAGKVGGDSGGLPVGTSTSSVDHASVGTGTVRVDLVNSHHDRATSRDLRKSGAVELHDLSSTSRDVVVTSTECLTASVCGVATEASGILLEGVAVGTVTRSVGVDTDGGTGTSCITSSLDDGSVASHEGRGSQKADGDGGNLGEHVDFVDYCLNRSEKRLGSEVKRY